MRYTKNGKSEAEAQAKALGYVWNIVGDHHDFDELQVWLDSVASHQSQKVQSMLYPEWLHIHEGYLEDGRYVRSLVDRNVVTEINPTGQELQVQGFIYMINLTDPDGNPMMEVTDWDVDPSTGMVNLITMPLAQALEILSDNGALAALGDIDRDLENDAISDLRSYSPSDIAEGVIVIGENIGWFLVDPTPVPIDLKILRRRWYDEKANPRAYIEPLDVSILIGDE